MSQGPFTTRKLIRARVKSLLLSNTAAGTKVYKNRPTPLWEGETPAVFVWTMDEDSDHAETAPRYYERHLKMVVEGLTAKIVDGDDEADDLSEEIEQVLLRNRYLKTLSGGQPTGDPLVHDTKLTKTVQGFIREADKPHFTTRHIFDVHYQSQGALDTADEDFDTIAIDVEPKGAV